MVTRWRARPRFFQSVQERAVWDKEEFETYFMAHGDMFDYQDTEDGGKVRRARQGVHCVSVPF